MSTTIIVQASGGGRPEDQYETTPEDAARLLASLSGIERPGFAAEVAGCWHDGDLSAYEVTDEHGRTFLAAPEDSPHLAVSLVGRDYVDPALEALIAEEEAIERIHREHYDGQPEGATDCIGRDIVFEPFEVVAEGVWDEDDGTLVLLSDEALHEVAEEDAIEDRRRIHETRCGIAGHDEDCPWYEGPSTTVERWIVWGFDGPVSTSPHLFETYEEAEDYRRRLAPSWNISPVYAEV